MINIMESINKCEYTMHKGIKVISICDLFKTIWPDYFGNFELYLEREEELATVIRPIIGKEIHYYAKDKRHFVIWKAVQEAQEKNLPIVIVENMS